MNPLLVPEIILAALGMVVGSYLVAESAEGLASKLRVSGGNVMLFIFPLATASPEIAVILVGLLSGGAYGQIASITTALGEPFIVLLIGMPAVTIAGLLRGTNPLSGARGGYIVPLLSPFVLLAGLLLLNGTPALGPFLISSTVLLYALATKGRGTKEIPRSKMKVAVPVFLLGIAMIVLLTRALLYLVGDASRELRLSPVLISLFIFPLTTTSPEILAGAMFAIKERVEASLAALTGEFILETTLLPGIVAILHDTVPQPLVLVVLATAVSSAITVVASRIRPMLYALVAADLVILALSLLTL